MKNNRTIGFVTTDFGFGPVSKCSYIITALQDKMPNATIKFYGGKDSIAFIRKNNKNVKILERNKIMDKSVGIKDCDLVVNILDVDLLTEWDNNLPKMYFVDSLSWMWDKPMKNIELIKSYYIQDYLADKEKNKEYEIYTNVKLIPPITENATLENVSKKNMLLVNYSGVFNPFTEKQYYVNYCKVNTECILEEASKKFDTIKFSMNEEISSILEKEKESLIEKYNVNIEFGFYKHSEFIKMIQEARLVLSNAGITATLEMYNYNKCFGYLLGTNYSQALMTQKYYDTYRLENVIPFSMLEINMEEIYNLPEEEGVKLINNAVISILKNNKKQLKEYFKRIINMSKDELINNNSKLPVNTNGYGQCVIANDIIKELEK